MTTSSIIKFVLEAIHEKRLGDLLNSSAFSVDDIAHLVKSDTRHALHGLLDINFFYDIMTSIARDGSWVSSQVSVTFNKETIVTVAVTTNLLNDGFYSHKVN